MDYAFCVSADMSTSSKAVFSSVNSGSYGMDYLINQCTTGGMAEIYAPCYFYVAVDAAFTDVDRETGKTRIGRV